MRATNSLFPLRISSTFTEKRLHNENEKIIIFHTRDDVGRRRRCDNRKQKKRNVEIEMTTELMMKSRYVNFHSNLWIQIGILVIIKMKIHSRLKLLCTIKNGNRVNGIGSKWKFTRQKLIQFGVFFLKYRIDWDYWNWKTQSWIIRMMMIKFGDRPSINQFPIKLSFAIVHISFSLITKRNWWIEFLFHFCDLCRCCVFVLLRSISLAHSLPVI